MIDIEASVRALLAGNAAVTTLAGDRILAAPQPFRDYSVEAGPLVLFGVRGGQTDYSKKLLRPSIQFRCYASTEAMARRLDRAVYDSLNRLPEAGCGGAVASAAVESFGSLLHEPETEWPYVLSFWRLLMFNAA